MNRRRDRALARHKSYKRFMQKGKEMGESPTVKRAFFHGFNSGFNIGRKHSQKIVSEEKNG